MNHDLRVFDTEAEVFDAAAQTFADAVRAVLAVRPRFTVALSGGSTPRALFERLAQPPHRDEIAWRTIDWFWGDERAVGPDDADSNYRMARETLLSKLNIAPDRVHRLRGEAEPLARGADEYVHELAETFGVSPDGPPPSLDLVLLGMGSDGHTASLFPFTSALDERRRWVVANDVPQLNTKRLTLTYPMLNAASCVMFLVSGVGKAKVLREVLEGASDPRRLPSQAVQPTHGRLVWFLDRAAAGLLESV
jgi:6-phosphogluconolactonase